MWDGSRRTRLPKEALRGADFEELARSGLEHPELAAHRVRRVRRSVLRRDHHAATLSYRRRRHGLERSVVLEVSDGELLRASRAHEEQAQDGTADRKSTRLNSSHTVISYAVFCLKKKK